MNPSGWGPRVNVFLQNRRKVRISRKCKGRYNVVDCSNGKKDTVCPLEKEWSYDKTLQAWPFKVNVVLAATTKRELKRKREPDFNCAKTCQTIIAPLTVWQIPNSNKVHVGHLGIFECVKQRTTGPKTWHNTPKTWSHCVKCLTVPQEDDLYFLGQWKKGTFIPLKREENPPRIFDRREHKTLQLYKTL